MQDLLLLFRFSYFLQVFPALRYIMLVTGLEIGTETAANDFPRYTALPYGTQFKGEEHFFPLDTAAMAVQILRVYGVQPQEFFKIFLPPADRFRAQLFPEHHRPVNITPLAVIAAVGQFIPCFHNIIPPRLYWTVTRTSLNII
jgi:hypothetical protein